MSAHRRRARVHPGRQSRQIQGVQCNYFETPYAPGWSISMTAQPATKFQTDRPLVDLREDNSTYCSRRRKTGATDNLVRVVLPCTVHTLLCSQTTHDMRLLFDFTSLFPMYELLVVACCRGDGAPNARRASTQMQPQIIHFGVPHLFIMRSRSLLRYHTSHAWENSFYNAVRLISYREREA